MCFSNVLGPTSKAQMAEIQRRGSFGARGRCPRRDATLAQPHLPCILCRGPHALVALETAARCAACREAYAMGCGTTRIGVSCWSAGAPRGAGARTSAAMIPSHPAAVEQDALICLCAQSLICHLSLRLKSNEPAIPIPLARYPRHPHPHYPEPRAVPGPWVTVCPSRRTRATLAGTLMGPASAAGYSCKSGRSWKRTIIVRVGQCTPAAGTRRKTHKQEPLPG